MGALSPPPPLLSAEGAAQVVVDLIATPIFFVQTDGFVVFANHAAEATLRESGALSRQKGRLTFRRKGDAQSLAAALARVADRQAREALRLRARGGNVNYVLTIAPVPGQPLLVIAVVDLRGGRALPTGWTARLFGFSPQGAALAEALFQGLSLAEFAERSGVTIGGVRTRLKKLLSATAARSQADLIAILLRASVVSQEGGAGRSAAG